MVSKKDIIENVSGLRFGIMCNGRHLQIWQVMIIKNLINDGIKPMLLIIDARQPKSWKFFKKVKNYPYRNFFYRIYQRFIFKPSYKKIVEFPFDR